MKLQVARLVKERSIALQNLENWESDLKNNTHERNQWWLMEKRYEMIFLGETERNLATEFLYHFRFTEKYLFTKRIDYILNFKIFAM